MRELTENFVDEANLDQNLGRVTAAAVELIDGVDYADVLLIDGGRFRSVAPTDAIVSDLDELQMRTEQGPCLEAAEDHTAIRSPDLEQDPRWPAFSSAAVAAGVRSLVSFQLFVQGTSMGALDVYADRVNACNNTPRTPACYWPHTPPSRRPSPAAPRTSPRWAAGTSSAKPKAS